MLLDRCYHVTDAGRDVALMKVSAILDGKKPAWLATVPMTLVTYTGAMHAFNVGSRDGLPKSC